MEMEDAKKALMAMMLAAASSEGAGTLEMPAYETEEEALEHAKIIAALKPGDDILVKCIGEDAKRGVYVGPANKSSMIDYLEYGDDKTIRCMSVPYRSVRIPV